MQNKLNYAIHGNTAAKLIYNRADSEKTHMGLSSWEDAPEGKIPKYDLVVAKHYQTENKLQSLGRIVSVYLNLAEDMSTRHIPMTMEDWAKRLGIFLQATDRDVLVDSGKISAAIAKMHAESEFEKYRIEQDKLF